MSNDLGLAFQVWDANIQSILIRNNFYMSEEITRKKTPPYIAIGRLEKLLKIVSDKSPSTLNAEYFVNQGFGSYDAILAVNTLKFLGLVSNAGVATPSWHKWQTPGEVGKKERESAIRNGYAELLKVSPKAAEDSREAVKADLMSTYHISPRVAEAAAPVFIKLSEIAGWREPSATQQRVRGVQKSPARKNIAGSKKAVNVEPNATLQAEVRQLAAIRVIPSKILLYIPESIQNRAWIDEEIGADLRAIVKSLRDFGEKYLDQDGDAPREME